MEQPMKSTCSPSSSSSYSSSSSSTSSSSSSRWYSSSSNSSSSSRRRACSCQRRTSSSSSTSMLFMFLLLLLLLPIGAHCRRLGPVRVHSTHSTGSQTKKTTRTLSTRILQDQEQAVALKPKHHQIGSGDDSRRDLSGLGSSPPQCNSKCGRCSPCRAVHVPIQPGLIRTTEYYPEAWRCKCNNKLYMP